MGVNHVSKRMCVDGEVDGADTELLEETAGSEEFADMDAGTLVNGNECMRTNGTGTSA